MEYKKEFVDFLDLAKQSNQTYIGHGNPNGKILIVANEPGTVDKDLIDNDLNVNRNRWESNLNDPRDMSEVEDVFGNGEFWGRFNPLWPFKGQLFTTSKKVYRHTSRTWLQYQKLIDMIISKRIECKRSREDSLDFFRTAFITDFSAVYGLSSKDIDSANRHASISSRLPLFRSSFIEQFPIIIVASGHYVRDIDLLNDLTKVFPGFSPNRIERITGKPGWMNVHISDDGKRILVHTKHFASAISDPYLAAIAMRCREFFNNQ